MIQTSIELMTNWYWVLIAVFTGVGLISSWRHNKTLPALWGVSMSLVLYMGALVLEPILFGFMYYAPYTVDWYLSGAFTVLFAMLNGSFLYYLVKYGQVNERNKYKVKKTQAIAGFMSVLAIGVLVLPVGVNGYLADQTVTNIMTVQGSYGTGDQFGLYDGTDNMTYLFDNVTSLTLGDQVLGWESNNDTVHLGYLPSGASGTRDRVYYGDYNTYVGNGTYTMTPDWVTVSPTTYPTQYIYVPLNITNTDLGTYDFVRIHTDIANTLDGITMEIRYQNAYNGLDQIQPLMIDNNTFIGVIDYGVKNSLDYVPDGTVWLVIANYGADFDTDQISFSWSVEANTLEPSDQVFGADFTDRSVWVLTMVCLDIIYGLGVIFATPWIDLKIDN